MAEASATTKTPANPAAKTAKPPRGNQQATVRKVAAKLFETRGYHGTSMDDVAAGVQRNKGTLYYYYKGKSDILYDIYSDTLDIVIGVINSIPADASPDEALKALIRFELRSIAERPHETVVYFQEMRWIKEWLPRHQYREIRAREDQFTDWVTDVVQRGIDDGVFAPMDARIGALAVIGMTSWAYQWYRPNGRYSIDEIADMFVDIIMHGLGTREGR